MEESLYYHPKILEYMFRVQDVVSKYVKVFLNFKMAFVSRDLKDETQVKPKIKTLCKLIIAMTKYIGICVNLSLKQNEQALEVIESTFGRKVNWRIQEYLVKIEYWVKRLTANANKN